MFFFCHTRYFRSEGFSVLHFIVLHSYLLFEKKNGDYIGKRSY